MNILIKLAFLPLCVLILISLTRAYISNTNVNEEDLIQGKSLLYSLLTKFQQKVMNLEPIDRARSILTMLITKFGKIVTSYDIKVQRKFDPKVYDYIIVGSGSAGSVLANRLSENKTNRILILEAGGKEDTLQNIPILSFLLQKSKNDWIYESASLTRGAKGLNNRKIPIPRGKIVGGCSSINYMLYVRGNHKDYDEWEKLGATGWSFKNVFPYFVKSEDQKDNSTSKGYHGLGGPLTISTLNYAYEVDSAFLKACQEIGLKLGDINGEEQEQFMYSQFTIRDGKRCSTAKAFLAEATFRQNVRLMLFARVNRIVFDNKKAIGVKFTYNNREYEARAEKEIILSAGAINTPQILMLSGIGPQEHLDSLDIPVIVNSPGVGSNLQDHPYTIMAYETAKSTSFVYSRPTVLNDIKNFWKKNSGPFSSSGLNVIGFHKTKHSLDTRPDIQIHELSYIPGGAFPDLALGYLLNVKRSVLAKYFLPHIFKDGVMFAVTLVRPSSRGTVRLKSKDPRAPPIVDLNLFEEEKDVLSMVEGCKLILNITSAHSFQKLKPKRLNGILEGCEEFPLDSDKYLNCLIRTLTFTIYHAVGTAKMGSLNDPLAVVDSKLRVKGVENLRVVDASIMPTITTGNTNAPTIMIAEKASDIILGKSLKPSLPPYKDLNELLKNEEYTF